MNSEGRGVIITEHFLFQGLELGCEGVEGGLLSLVPQREWGAAGSIPAFSSKQQVGMLLRS